MDIILVHGYNVTSTKTYGVLPQRLKKIGHTVKNVYLSKYVTLDDDLTLADIVRAFQAALVDLYGSQFGVKRFACITHSTGGVVVRAWIDTYYSKRPRSLPISHLIMLAPPNNGSRLASVGKSRLSRLRSLWGFEPGVKILDSLELGNLYEWELNSAWALNKYHQIPGFFSFVITGQWIDKKLWDTIIPATYERGSDGVVRAASANLNFQKFIFGKNGLGTRQGIKGVPFLITPKTSHSDEDYGIVGSIPLKGDHPILDAIFEALGVRDKKSFLGLETAFALKTLALQSKETYFDGSLLDRYSQIVFRIRDDLGNRLPDYAIEIINSSGRGDLFMTGFFADHHRNEVNNENFTYYLNYDKALIISDGKIGFKIQCVPDSPLISYPEFNSLQFLSDVKTLLKPNQTTLIDVILQRRLNKNIFRLTDNLPFQKIKSQPGSDWI